MANVKFIRVKGRVVPINSDEKTVKHGKKRYRTTDDISKGEAVKELRQGARSSSRVSRTATKFSVTSGALGLGLAVGSYKFGGLKSRVGQGLAVGSAIATGVATSSGTVAKKQSSAAKQYRDDAKSIQSGKTLEGRGKYRGRAAREARDHALFFQSKIKQKKSLSAQVIDALRSVVSQPAPGAISPLPEPANPSPGTTSV